MRLSELQSKNIITLDGKLVGSIIDVVINDGKIDNLIVEKNKFFISMLSSKNEIEIKWNQIKTIGDDVILVDVIWQTYLVMLV